MSRKLRSYYSHWILLEKLKQKIWILIVLSKFLSFLAAVVNYYLRR